MKEILKVKKLRQIISKLKLPALGLILYTIGVLIIPIQAIESQDVTTFNNSIFQKHPISEIPAVDTERIDYAQGRYFIEKEIDKLHNYLMRRNRSVFASREISRIIVEESIKAGAEYRIVVGIMTKESGNCVAPYKGYNCFGYLNKVQYSSFEEAFKILVPKVARIVAKFNWNTDALAQAYGPVNKVDWSRKVYAVARSI